MSLINLEIELISRNEATLAKEQKFLDDQAKIDAMVDNMLQMADEKYRDELLGELGFNYKINEALAVRKERDELARFPANRIFSRDAIKATCIEYGLRCLPTRYFKGQLDSQLGAKLEEFKRMCGDAGLPKVRWEENLDPMQYSVMEFIYGGYAPRAPRELQVEPATQFFICAPADQFVLQDKPKDPLLFCRLNADKFFLLLKWGDDLETASIRAGQTTAANWNSIYKPEEAPKQVDQVVDTGVGFVEYQPTVTAAYGAVSVDPRTSLADQATMANQRSFFARAFGLKKSK